MSVREFRQKVREAYPHVTVRVRTVDFTDLARTDAKCLTVEGDRTFEELQTINEWAREAGILPDGNVRYYGD